MHIPIRRSHTDRVFAGVLGGLAEKFGWDPKALRIIWIILTFAGFSGLIAYLILWLLMEP